MLASCHAEQCFCRRRHRRRYCKPILSNQKPSNQRPFNLALYRIIMSPILKKYKAAAVNAEPGWFDLEESVKRTIHWIDEAGQAGCKFIAFPELCE